MIKSNQMSIVKEKVLGSIGAGFYSTVDFLHFPCQCGWAHICSHKNLKFLLKKSKISEDVDVSTLTAKGCVSCSADADIVLQKTEE